MPKMSVLFRDRGKLRLKASWSTWKRVTRRGLIKVYGMNQLMGWTQEIEVLDVSVHTC